MVKVRVDYVKELLDILEGNIGKELSMMFNCANCGEIIEKKFEDGLEVYVIDCFLKNCGLEVNVECNECGYVTSEIIADDIFEVGVQGDLTALELALASTEKVIKYRENQIRDNQHSLVELIKLREDYEYRIKLIKAKEITSNFPIGSYVMMLEDNKKAKKGEVYKVTYVSHVRSVVIFEDMVSEEVIEVPFGVGMELVGEKEYHKYLFESSFDLVGRQYGEYEDGDVLVSREGNIYRYESDDFGEGFNLFEGRKSTHYNDSNELLNYAPFILGLEQKRVCENVATRYWFEGYFDTRLW